MNNYLILFMCIVGPIICYGQADINTAQQKMISMQEVTTRPYTLGSRYFQKDANEPYTGILYTKYDNGNIMTMQEFKDGLSNGTWTNYDPMGNKEEQGTYRNNKVEGPVIRYYENGMIKAKGQYLHWSQPIGEWIYYDSEGKEVHRITYTR